jgi:hypothetical protein
MLPETATRSKGPDSLSKRHSTKHEKVVINERSSQRKMLARERKRALWSFGIGIILAVVLEGTLRTLDWQTRRHLAADIADCEKPEPVITSKTNPKAGASKGWKPICEPDDLRGIRTQAPDGTYSEPMTDEKLISDGGIYARIIRADEDVKSYQDNEVFYSVALLLLSVAPFVWYFFLDRIREFSAAVSGRDRSS